jgi:excisionase family DNA binding protein
MADHSKPLAAPPQVAAYLGVPEPTLTEWRYKGKGPQFIKVGRHVRYRWSDVEDWLRRQSVARHA